MNPLLLNLDIGTWIALIDFIGSLIIVGYVVAALLTLLHQRNIERVRLLVADGALWGLNFKVAATLLKTITLTNWQAIALFVVIFTIRTLLKHAFTWERAQIERTARIRRDIRPR